MRQLSQLDHTSQCFEIQQEQLGVSSSEERSSGRTRRWTEGSREAPQQEQAPPELEHVQSRSAR